MSAHVRSTREGPLARITLDRPPLNVLTTSMLRELAAALAEADASPDVRLVRLDALGKMFSAGVDVADHVGDAVGPMLDALRELFLRFERLNVPTLAVVHGAALGGGLEVVLGTDLCLASERASFGQPEVKLGLFAPPASVLLPRIVGERRALGLLLSGQTLGAREAYEIGIVNRVFPEATFGPDADAFVAELLALSGSALRLAKKAVRAARGLPVERAHEACDRLYREELLHTEDAGEGLRAFLGKRAPVWKHH